MLEKLREYKFITIFISSDIFLAVTGQNPLDIVDSC